MARPFPIHNVTDDSALGGSVIERSLRFNDGDSAHLNRTPSSASNRRTWTWSAWVKRGELSQTQGRLFGAGVTGSDYFSIYFPSGDQLRVLWYEGGETLSTTTALFRDSTSWYHFVVAVDTTQSTTADRIKMYANGNLLERNSTTPAQNYETSVNSTVEHNVGKWLAGDASYYDGYIAEVNFVDGLQLTPSSFGYTDFQTGLWRPKGYSGSYGTNGFRLPFTNTGSFIDFFDESSSKHIFTRTGEVIHTSDQKKNGATSIYFDDSSDTLSTVDSSDFTFGTNDFTIEAYVRRTRQGDDEWFFIQSDGSSANTSIGLHFWSSSYGDVNKPSMRMRIGGSNYDTNGTTVTGANTWYHIAGVRQGNTFRIYVNGVQEGTTTNSGSINDPTTPMIIGAVTASGSAGLKGYMDQVRISNVCRYPDGTSFTPPTAQFTSDSNTKLLVQSNVPLNTSLGSDASGNNHHFTPNELKSSDAVLDTPTNVFSTFNANILSPLIGFEEGNLHIDVGSNHETGYGNFSLNTGKWYWEGKAKRESGSLTKWTYGVSDNRNMSNLQASGTNYLVAVTANTYAHGDTVSIYGSTFYKNGTPTSSYQTALALNDIVAIALDVDAGKVWFARNGTWVNGSASASTTLNPDSHDTTVTTGQTYVPAFSAEGVDWEVNFGQDDTFSGTSTSQGNKDENEQGKFYYAVPSGFKAICSHNLPITTPSIIKPQKHFDTLLYTGTGSANHHITGLEFKPDFVWIKARTQAYTHLLYDSVRGVGKQIYSDQNVAEYTNLNNLYSFNHNGFSLGQSGSDDVTNKSGDNFVAWCWKAGGAAVTNNDGSISSQVSVNREAGFSIVKYTGNESNATVGHGLGAAPDHIIFKETSSGSNWYNYVRTLGANKSLRLSQTSAAATDSKFQNTHPTSSVFYLNDDTATNQNGESMIAYCWTEIPGFSKIGSYVGNGNSDGPYFYCGFRPAWILLKRDDGTAPWRIFDSKRPEYNGNTYKLQANDTTVEATSAQYLDFLSNGFKVRDNGSYINASSADYIFMAFAEQIGDSPYSTETNAR